MIGGGGTLALHFLRGRRLRLGLVVAALALGVAVVCAVDILNRAVLRAFVEVVDAMAGRAALQVGAGDAGLFREGVIERVARVPGVAAALPVMSATAFLAGGVEPITVYGVDLLSDQPARTFAVNVPRETLEKLFETASEPRAVFVPRALAERLGLGRDDTLELDTPAGRRRYLVRDVVDLQGMSRTVAADLLIMHLPGAQLDFGRLRLVNRGDVMLEPDADIDRVRTAIAAMLPPGLEVTTPLQRKMDLRRVMRSLQVILWGIAIVAVVLSALVAFDALAAHFESQAWQAGMLRAVGLRIRTVWLELLKQGGLLGVAGVLLGVPAGVALGCFLVPLVAAAAAVNYKITAPSAAATVSVWSILVAVTVGLTAAVLAAGLPAWRAARVSIVATVGLKGREAPAAGGGVPWALRAAVLAATIASVWLARRSAVASLAATGLLVATTALAARPLVSLSAPVLQRVLDRLAGPAGPFACASVLQETRRTALTVGVLGVGLGSVLWMRTVTTSFEESLVYALGGSLRADLIVAATRVVSGWVPAPVAAEVLPELGRVPGVRLAAGNRLVDWTFRDASIALNAFDPSYFVGDAFEKPPLVGAHEPDAWEAVGRGEAVIVSTNFLLNFGVGVGDRIELVTPTGPLALPIAGATLAFVSPGGTIEMSRDVYVRHWNDSQVNRIWLRTERGASLATIRDSIAHGPGATYGVRAVSAAEMRDYLVRQARRAFAPMAVIEVVVLVVALLSMSDTLAASVVRRLRQIGTLRSVGARRRHVVRIVLAEALVIGALGLALAVASGLALGVLWVHLTLPHLLGWLLDLRLPWARALVVTIALIVICLLAAVLPARRAARLEPAMALRYE